MTDWLSGIVPSELLRRVGSKRRARQEDVEDAIQDVLLGILQKLRSDSPPPAPLRPDAYLVQAVHNRLTSMQRSDWRQVAASDDGTMLEETPHPQLEPAEIHEALERNACFARLVRAFGGGGSAPDASLERAFGALQATLAARLTDRQWILIRMRVLEGMRIVDCARALNVSVGTAHNWTHAALEICRAALEEAGIDAGPLADAAAGPGETGG
jgi:RNA polymerase sigma factor (sigma-70 family)